MKNIVTGKWLAALLLALLPWAASAQLAAIPPLADRVHDTTLTLGTAEREALVAKLKAFEQRKGSQIAVLMVASTQPEDITSYAIRAAQTYKLGRPGVGDGILIVVAKDDRRARIDVAKALEGPVPDVSAGRIVRETFAPAFRDGRYGDGLIKGTDQLIGLIDGEALPPPVQRSQAQQMPAMFGGGIDWADLGIFLFIAVIFGGSILRGVFGRGLGSLATGAAAGGVAWWFTASVVLAGIAGVVALVVSLFTALGSALSHAANRAGRSRRGGWDAPVVWGGGGGGGGIDFGGFSSGGGGDFGGGGASGDW